MSDLNVKVRDLDSDITGKGKHRRLLVMSDPRGKLITVREDDCPHTSHLRAATPQERLKATNGWQRLHPRGSRLDYQGSSEPYTSGDGSWESVEHYYNVVGRT